MAWSDEPTHLQLGTIYSWFRWILSIDEAQEAVAWLEQNATRREVSFEMTRLKGLKDKGLLNANNCFESEIWEDFVYEEES